MSLIKMVNPNRTDNLKYRFLGNVPFGDKLIKRSRVYNDEALGWTYDYDANQETRQRATGRLMSIIKNRNILKRIYRCIKK
jgi:hypothetical protein